MPDPLAEYPVVIEVPIQWGDQDAFGHVNNTVPIRWFESSRIAYLERCGLSQLMTRDRLGPILASVTCHYRAQLHYPGIVRVGSRVSRLGRTSLIMQHLVARQDGAQAAADGQSVVVLFDYSAHRPCPLPAELREQIVAFEPVPPA